jgi:hypothetical protein
MLDLLGLPAHITVPAMKWVLLPLGLAAAVGWSLIAFFRRLLE